MAGRHLKELFRAFGSGDELSFRRAALAIVEEEEAKHHVALARDLRKLLASGEQAITSWGTLPDPPLDRDGEWPLAEVRQPFLSLEDLVLAAGSLQKLQGMVKEVPSWDKLAGFGIPQRRRLLFYGPPGCGKSSAAEALATELSVPLLVVRLDSVISSYLGQSASNLRRIMDCAEEGPRVVLFDEFDAIGRARDDPAEHGEIKRVVNAFLQMLDNYRGSSLIVAATNHEQLLDPALWRRFDEVVHFPPPTVHQIRSVLRKRLRPVRHRGLAIEKAASKLKGLPHAAAEAAAWGALRRAVLAEREQVDDQDLNEAVSDVSERPW
ncbi:MAG: ATP-binding protein [Acidimicrobiaceae bacterium]|nr:ATP-binding protein [Acidimicrobiia bacterium]MCY4492786.1 ATP-binding protein [Acidimicrobiaceae bacterium]